MTLQRQLVLALRHDAIQWHCNVRAEDRAIRHNGELIPWDGTRPTPVVFSTLEFMGKVLVFLFSVVASDGFVRGCCDGIWLVHNRASFMVWDYGQIWRLTAMVVIGDCRERLPLASSR